MNHPKPGTAEYQEHVVEEIECFSRFFKDGEGHETLHIPIPPSWQEAERRAAMVILEKTGAFINGHIDERLKRCPHPRLLSLGSGPGGMEISYAQTTPHAEIVCMDLNPEVLDLGRERAGQLGLKMEFIPTDLNVVELPENEFDIVYCAASLHHIIELERLAEQIRKTLKADGDLVVIDVIPPSGYLMWPETREVVQAIFKTLPQRFRVNHTGYSVPRVDEEIWEADTSQYGMECVRSGDIVGVLGSAFPIKAFVPYFSISRRLLDSMYGPNYDLADPLSNATFNWIWEMDRYYIESNMLLPETFFGIYGNDKTKVVNWQQR